MDALFRCRAVEWLPEADGGHRELHADVGYSMSCDLFIQSNNNISPTTVNTNKWQMMRRGGILGAAPDTQALIPQESDT